MNSDNIITNITHLKSRFMKDVISAYRDRGNSYGSERFLAWKKVIFKFLDDNLSGERKRLEEKLLTTNSKCNNNVSDLEIFWTTYGENCISYIDSLLDDISSGEYCMENKTTKSENIDGKLEDIAKKSNKIFIVHGHDSSLKFEVAQFLQTLGFDAIILHLQASGSKTIIEKIEHYTDVGFAIILYTPDDLGNKKDEAIKNNLKTRARQNVIFEHGYLMAKLGRKNVIPLVFDVEEMPGDVSGIIYVENKNWKIDIIQEMIYAGYKIDISKMAK